MLTTGPVALTSTPPTDIQTLGEVFPIGLQGDGRRPVCVSLTGEPSEMTSKLPSDMVVGLRSSRTVDGVVVCNDGVGAGEGVVVVCSEGVSV